MRRPSPAAGIAIAALFFSFAGTGLAASHYLITSTKQIKPSVLAALRGASGRAGATGATGAPGTGGAPGATGLMGPSGDPGATFYAGRVVEDVGAPEDTFLTVPGVAHLAAFDCTASDTEVEMFNDSNGTADAWVENDTDYSGPSWATMLTPPASSDGTVWHLGIGSGAGAEVITVTVSYEATGSNCIVQGTADVVPSS
jgi:hypothetical protein